MSSQIKRLRSTSEDDFMPGTLIWGQYSKSKTLVWPAIVLNENLCNKLINNNKFDGIYVYWLEDNRVSKILSGKAFHFIPYFSKYRNSFQCNTKRYVAVVMAIRIHAKRLEVTLSDDHKSVIEWAESGFPSACKDVDAKLTIPDEIYDHLRQLNLEVETYRNTHTAKNECVKEVRQSFKKLEEDSSPFRGFPVICIRCHKSTDDKYLHPLLDASMCQPCFTNCIICGAAGPNVLMIKCSKNQCYRKFCNSCIDELCLCGKPEKPDQFWVCFICKETAVISTLKPRANWLSQVIDMFHENEVSYSTPLKTEDKIKQPIRVLGLYDSMGSGMYILNMLGIEVEKYFIVGFDEDAKLLTKAHFGNKMEYLDEITAVTSSTIKKIGRIDLLLCGFPGNYSSFSIVPNAAVFAEELMMPRFLEFRRILCLLVKQQTVPFFWVMEWAGDIDKNKLIFMNRHMECTPVIINSPFGSPSLQLKLFWSNIPNITNSTIESGKSSTISDYNNAWIVDIEEALGFTRYYTDVGNFSIQRRRRLLSKAWCINSISSVLNKLHAYLREP